MEIVKYLIPILSFLLGAAFTLLLKKKERKDSAIGKASEELSDLATDWYTQLHNILWSSKIEDETETRKLLLQYERNRLIVPKFVRSLEVLRRYEDSRDLYSLGEQFLKRLTFPAVHRTGVQVGSVETLENVVCCALVSRLTDFSEIVDNNAKLERQLHPKIPTDDLYVDFTNRIHGRDFDLSIPRNKSLVKLEDYLFELDVIVQNINREAGKLSN